MSQLTQASFSAPVVHSEFDDIFKRSTMAASEGIMAGMSYDRIVLQQGRFYLKTAEGEETMLRDVEIPIVLIDANPALCRRLFQRAWNPSQEASAPDCMSYDGKAPTPDSQLKQSATCVDCPHNAWGTGRDQNGNATKGKACHEYKQLAVYYNNRVYGLAIPRTSLGSWKEYVSLVSSNGRLLQKIVTVVGVKPSKDNTTMVMEFQFGGDLTDPQVRKIASVFTSPEVKKIVAPHVAADQGQASAPVQQTVKPDITAGNPTAPKSTSSSIFGDEDDVGDEDDSDDETVIADLRPAKKAKPEADVVNTPVRQTTKRPAAPPVDAGDDDDDDALAAELGI